ncbi:MoaD/ThiS family protein [Paralcaligenes sp. KSB-10]|uniref:MoaD/ThiS family protein n=1 Tax=Paralcaligenes sp. KSB-10 TaxID=2901142 RepID=UPI001E4B6235|nr:MoaD/ThiS family protein [Paralcaligenes sp. KSB-10]UHL62626.1 MoaD/ThiS family protein [Paralcaligenes sp. KSB-10]
MNGTAIKVLYFARVADLTRIRQESWPLSHALSGTDWLRELEGRYPQLAPTGRLKLAVNQYHVDHQSLIQPGDEVAVFEPVTGG